jgi:hypothetical protein
MNVRRTLRAKGEKKEFDSRAFGCFLTKGKIGRKYLR